MQTVLASDVDFVVVTAPANGPPFEAELHGLQWTRAEVENPQQGQSQSVRAGAQAVENGGDFDAILFTPCDLPLLSVSHLNALIKTHRSGTWDIAASRYNQVLGAPLIVSRALWPELHELRGDTGARKLLASHSQTTTSIEWTENSTSTRPPMSTRFCNPYGLGENAFSLLLRDAPATPVHPLRPSVKGRPQDH